MKIVILDTGCANLTSVQAALKRLDYQSEISLDPKKVLRADRLLLPGVGTARAAITQLQQRQLIELIPRCTQPVLGICLGMQLLTEYSEESQGTAMLGIMPGRIAKMPCPPLPLPHMGWDQLSAQHSHPLFHNIAPDSHFYFVHSYALPVSVTTIAECQYGQAFSAAIHQDNFYGVQFHPERSGKAGSQLLKNFVERL